MTATKLRVKLAPPKIDPALKAYSLSKHVASFVGFAPADEPVISIMVVIDEPKRNKAVRRSGGSSGFPGKLPEKLCFITISFRPGCLTKLLWPARIQNRQE
jgi:hypothetical protein